MKLKQITLVFLGLSWLILAGQTRFTWALPTTNPILSSLPDNTVADLGAFTCTNVGTNNCNTVQDYSGFIYDQNNHRLLMFGGGHATTFTDAVFSFNPNTLTWSELYPPTPCSNMTSGNMDTVNGAWLSGPAGPYPRPVSRHTYDDLAVADGLQEFIVLYQANGGSNGCGVSDTSIWGSGYKVAHYNLLTNTWSFSPTASPGGDSEAPGTAYDPISGKIVMLGAYGMWIYDPVKRIKTKVIKDLYKPDPGYANDLVYYPPNQKMYYFNRNFDQVWEITLDRTNFSNSTITVLPTTGTYPPHGEPGYAYDAVNQIIGGAISSNRFYAFNPKTKSWTNELIQGGSPGDLAFHTLAYDPVNNVFFFFNDWRLGNGAKMWAYRYKRSSSTGPTPPAAPVGLQVK